MKFVVVGPKRKRSPYFLNIYYWVQGVTFKGTDNDCRTFETLANRESFTTTDSGLPFITMKEEAAKARGFC